MGVFGVMLDDVKDNIYSDINRVSYAIALRNAMYCVGSIVCN